VRGKLIFYTINGTALNRPAFNSRVRRPAGRATGIPNTRENGMHVLRHADASAAYLGHADPGFTLRIYTHLLPSSEDRTHRAIDQAFQDDPQADDGLDRA
jgi:integrase